MNKERRKNINELVEQLERIKELVNDLQAEEQEYLDSIPENLQGSERYEKAEMAVSYLDDAYNSLEDATTALTEATE